jgi:hypothetical protein
MAARRSVDNVLIDHMESGRLRPVMDATSVFVRLLDFSREQQLRAAATEVADSSLRVPLYMAAATLGSRQLAAMRQGQASSGRTYAEVGGCGAVVLWCCSVVMLWSAVPAELLWCHGAELPCCCGAVLSAAGWLSCSLSESAGWLESVGWLLVAGWLNCWLDGLTANNSYLPPAATHLFNNCNQTYYK